MGGDTLFLRGLAPYGPMQVRATGDKNNYKKRYNKRYWKLRKTKTRDLNNLAFAFKSLVYMHIAFQKIKLELHLLQSTYMQNYNKITFNVGLISLIWIRGKR